MKETFAVHLANRRMPRRVFIALLAFFTFFPTISFADAVLYVSPEKGTYEMGQTFEIKVYADTGGKLINAAEGDLSYNTDALEVENISKDGSILTSWSTPPEFSNEDGTVRFAGWTKKNYAGSNGLLLTITFKALRNMVGNARLAAGAILAADGAESNIITSMRSGIFTIAPQEKPDYVPDAAAGSTGAASSTPQAKVPAPVFDEIPDEVAVGDHIVVRGNTEPNAHVSIYLSRGSESETQTELLSASDGSFTFVSGEPVVEGVYHLRSTAVAQDGRQSVQSDTVDITAASAGAAASALFGVSLLLETLPFLALIILGGLGAAYIYHRHQIAKMHYRGESFFDQE